MGEEKLVYMHVKYFSIEEVDIEKEGCGSVVNSVPRAHIQRLQMVGENPSTEGHQFAWHVEFFKYECGGINELLSEHEIDNGLHSQPAIEAGVGCLRLVVKHP